MKTYKEMAEKLLRGRSLKTHADVLSALSEDISEIVYQASHKNSLTGEAERYRQKFAEISVKIMIEARDKQIIYALSVNSELEKMYTGCMEAALRAYYERTTFGEVEYDILSLDDMITTFYLNFGVDVDKMKKAATRKYMDTYQTFIEGRIKADKMPIKDNNLDPELQESCNRRIALQDALLVGIQPPISK